MPHFLIFETHCQYHLYYHLWTESNDHPNYLAENWQYDRWFKTIHMQTQSLFCFYFSHLPINALEIFAQQCQNSNGIQPREICLAVVIHYFYSFSESNTQKFMHKHLLSTCPIDSSKMILFGKRFLGISILYEERKKIDWTIIHWTIT